jgi:large repetitive protein
VDAQPAVEETRRFAALTDDLALKMLIAVATTVTLGRLGFDPTTALMGAALSPVFAEFLKVSVQRRQLGRRRLLLLTLLLFLLHCIERVLAALRRRQPKPPPAPPVAGAATRRALLLTGAVASVATVAAFSTAEAISGNSLVADRPLTFFPGEDPLPADLVPPALTLPADIVVEATGPRRVWFAVSAADRRDGALEPTCTHRPGARFPIGRTRVSCEVGDKAGNKSVGGFVVTVHRLEPGETIRMRFPERVDVEAASPDGAVANFTVMAWAADQAPLTPTCSPRTGSRFPLGRRTVTCSAADGSERVTRRFAVVVADTSAPRLIVPPDVTWETIAAARVVDYDVSARDRVDGVVAVDCTPRSGSTFSLGTRRVRCTATDEGGNLARGSFAVTVVRSDDTTAPELDLPEGTVAEATSGAGAVVSYEVAADDNETDEPAISCTPASGATFAVGSTPVRCTAVDAAGNTDTGVFTVTVADTREPSLTLPGDQVAEATSAAGAAVSYSAAARDAVDGPLAVACSKPSGSIFGLLTTEVRCTARDKAGNTAEDAFDVTVRDTTGPAIDVAGTSAEATSRVGAAVSYKATANDLVEGPATLSCSPSAGETFSLGDTEVKCSAADAKGNPSEKSFTVTVTDTTPPKVYAPANVVVEATSPDGALAYYKPAKAVDLVDGARRATCSPTSGSTFPLKVSTVTCSATDRRGNRGEATFLVTVRDTTPPALAIDDFTVWIDGGTGTRVDFPFATDVVAGDIVPTCRPPSGSFFYARRPRTVTCYAVDPSGNVSPTISFTVTVAYSPG